MQKIIKKLICIIMIFILSIFLLPNNGFVIKNVYADEEVKPGQRFNIPSADQYPQHVIYEQQYDLIHWIQPCRAIFEKWLEDKYTTDHGLCYLKTAGTDWILVAVAPTFGKVGDYLKVHVNHEGEQKDYYMIICDIKNPADDNAYFINNIHYGHRIIGCLNVLEFVYNNPSNPKNPDYAYLPTFKNVEYIINGGNYLENPDGPIGFDVEGDGVNESSTFAGACGVFFRQLWDSVSTFMDNSLKGTNKATSLYTLNSYTYSANGFMWPTYTTYITSNYGMRTDPVTGRIYRLHAGVDIGSAYGTEIWAAAPGEVILAGWSGGYGNCVMIKHDNGYTTLYGHQSKIKVSVGDMVRQGDVVGWVGSTGNSTRTTFTF